MQRDLGHDLAEAERDDREVVPAKPQRRQADDHADDRGEDRRDDEDEPDRDVDPAELSVDADRAEVEASTLSEKCGDANQAAV